MALGPISEIHTEMQPFDNFLLTKRGSLITAVELLGRDPDGLSQGDFLALSLIARSVFQGLDERITVSQYYIHFDSPEFSFRQRKHPVSNLLSQRRGEFLREKNLCASRIVHFLDIEPDENVNRLNIFTTLKHLVLSLKSRQSRNVIKNMLSSQQTVVCFLEDLERMSYELEVSVNNVVSKWAGVADCRQLSISEVWSYCRFLSNMSPTYLTTSHKEEVPAERWDACLDNGDREPVCVAGMDTLKMTGEENIYTRLLSVTRFGGTEVSPGIWAENSNAPAREKGNFVLLVRAKPISKYRLSMLFAAKENELERQGFNLLEMLKGEENKTAVEKRFTMSGSIREKFEELDEAQNLDDRWWNAHAMVAVFHPDVDRLKQTSRAVKRSLERAGLSAVWETVDLCDAWKTFLPGGGEFSIRDAEMTTSQLGAASLLYRAGEGQIQVKDLAGEEAQYVFQSADGTPFYYSPWTGGRCVVFGVGPIRSGKSFAKNTMACHYMKYDGAIFRGLDIDQGCEPVAEAFGEDGGIFRVEGGRTKGFNPFIMAAGEDDLAFTAHLKGLMLEMLRQNDSEELRQLDMHEQNQLDRAILSTLKLPGGLQRLGTVVSHTPKELQAKFNRWVKEGMYGHLFDQEEDAMGRWDKRIVAFNLQGVKDDPVILPLVMTEIFARVVKLFEDPFYQTIQKYLDIDEAHILLKSPYAREILVRAVRTWGKKFAGLGLWSQSPQEFLDVPDWPALRSAASTFFFMADPQLDTGLYKRTFPLTDGECEAIKNLIPKKELYIVQPDLKVSKKLVLEVEPEQYVVATSTPRETALRRRNQELYGVEGGFRQTAIELGLIKNGEERACGNY